MQTVLCVCKAAEINSTLDQQACMSYRVQQNSTCVHQTWSYLECAQNTATDTNSVRVTSANDVSCQCGQLLRKCNFR